jgi:hypothetical protein
MAHQLTRTGAELERLTRSLSDDLLPRAERVLEQTAGELVELRAATEAATRVAQGATRVVEAAGEMTAATKNALTPIIGTVGEVGGALRQVTAVAAGFRAALGALRRPSGSDGDDMET